MYNMLEQRIDRDVLRLNDPAIDLRWQGLKGCANITPLANFLSEIGSLLKRSDDFSGKKIIAVGKLKGGKK